MMASPNPHDPMPGADMNALVRIYDAHGMWLPRDVVDRFAEAWGVAPSTVKSRLNAHLDRLEQEPWSLLDRITRDALRIIAGAAHGVDAYRIARELGVAPPTQRLFYRSVLFADGLPELRELQRREMETMNEMVLGLGPRACRGCLLARGDRR